MANVTANPIEQDNFMTPITTNTVSSKVDGFKTPTTIYNSINIKDPVIDFMMFHKTVCNIIDKNLNNSDDLSTNQHQVWQVRVKGGLSTKQTIQEIFQLMQV